MRHKLARFTKYPRLLTKLLANAYYRFRGRAILRKMFDKICKCSEDYVLAKKNNLFPSPRANVVEHFYKAVELAAKLPKMMDLVKVFMLYPIAFKVSGLDLFVAFSKRAVEEFSSFQLSYLKMKAHEEVPKRKTGFTVRVIEDVCVWWVCTKQWSKKVLENLLSKTL